MSSPDSLRGPLDSKKGDGAGMFFIILLVLFMLTENDRTRWLLFWAALIYFLALCL